MIVLGQNFHGRSFSGGGKLFQGEIPPVKQSQLDMYNNIAKFLKPWTELVYKHNSENDIFDLSPAFKGKGKL